MSDKERAFRDRLAHRTAAGLIVGAILGAIAGLVIGSIAGGGHVPSIVMWTVSLAFAGLVVGGIWGGFVGLESPDPGAEPTQSKEPLDVPSITEERNPPPRSGA